eukprot:tig00000615_g2568.t1
MAPSAKPSEVSLVEVLGEGGFSDVWAARFKGESVAVKKPNELRNYRLPPGSVARAHTRELDVLTQAGYHPNVVRLLATSSDNNQPFLVLERMDFNLRELLEAKGPLDEGVCAHICAGILRGITHLLHCSIIYSDLKSMNVLLTERLDVKLCDFGLSVMLQGESFRPQRPTPVPEPAMDASKPLQGTERWMAPECRSGAAPTAASDVWSLGAVIFEMCTRDLPPKGANSMDTDAIKSKALRGLVYRCTDPNPSARPSPWELLAEFERMAAAPQAQAAVQRLAASLAGRGSTICHATLAASQRALGNGAFYGAPGLLQRVPTAPAALLCCGPASGVPPGGSLFEESVREGDLWLRSLGARLHAALGDLLWSAFRLERALVGPGGYSALAQPPGVRGALYYGPPAPASYSMRHAHEHHGHSRAISIF